MQKLLVILVLMLHINTSMFIPVLDEMDCYDASGRQVGDINTLIQFIEQVFLGKTHHSASDQDDDQAHYFNISYHAHHYIACKPVVFALQAPVFVPEKKKYHQLRDTSPLAGTGEVIVPPPKAAIRC